MGFFTKSPPCVHNYIVTSIRYVEYVGYSSLRFTVFTRVAATCVNCHQEEFGEFAGKLTVDTAKKLYDDRTPKEREVYIDV